MRYQTQEIHLLLTGIVVAKYPCASSAIHKMRSSMPSSHGCPWLVDLHQTAGVARWWADYDPWQLYGVAGKGRPWRSWNWNRNHETCAVHWHHLNQIDLISTNSPGESRFAVDMLHDFVVGVLLLLELFEVSISCELLPRRYLLSANWWGPWLLSLTSIDHLHSQNWNFARLYVEAPWLSGNSAKVIKATRSLQGAAN